MITTTAKLDTDNDGIADRIETRSINTNFYQVPISLATEIDSNADDKIDRIEIDRGFDGTANHIETWVYNDQGQTTRHEQDSDGDGTANHIETWVYNDQSQTTRHEQDSDGDGTANHIETWVYNDQSQTTRHEQDSDGDGTANHIETWVYNDQSQTTRYERDSNGDGTANHTESYEYNDLGLKIRYTIDRNGNGRVDEIDNFEYNNQNQLVRVRHEESFNGEGTASNIEISEYNDQGRLIRVRFEEDYNYDGKADEIEIYDYNDQGDVVRYRFGENFNDDRAAYYFRTWHYNNQGDRTRFERDSNGDGTAERIEVWNDQGQRTRYEEDYNRDGTADRIEVWNDQGQRTRYQRDDNRDGTAERIEIWEYNGQGQSTRYETDYNHDGTADRIEVWNDQGQRTRYQRDDNRDGTAERIEIWEYNGQGQRTRHETDYNRDGTADRIKMWNDQGQLTHNETDYNRDGTADYIETWDYNDQGDSTRFERDSNGDGTADFIKTWVYNDQGDSTRFERDSNGDGTADFIETWVYNDQGDSTRFERDSNGDGTANFIETWIYNDLGDRIRFERDSNGDGTADHIETWDYNDQGDSTRFERDSNGDGTAENIQTWEYVYNDQGQMTRRELDHDGDGTADVFEAWNDQGQITRYHAPYYYYNGIRKFGTWEYNEQGQLIRFNTDWNNDGTAEYIEEYNDQGQIIRDKNDSNRDGTVDFIVEYNGQGRKIRAERDYNHDGTMDRIVEFNDRGQTIRSARDFNHDGTLDYIEVWNEQDQETRIVWDANRDGTPEFIGNWTYNEQGQKTRYERDYNLDGTMDHIEDWNDQGQRTRYEKDYNLDGTMDHIEDWNDQGQRTRYEKDYNLDGTMDHIEDWNDQGQRTRHKRDSNRDGTAERTDVWVYNNQGQITRYEKDSNADGTAERIDNFVYNAVGILTAITRQTYDYDNGAYRVNTLTLDYNGKPIQTQIENDNTSPRTARRVYKDLDADGTPNEIVDYTYNAEGLRIKETIQFDDNDDRMVDRIEIRIDNNADGIWEEIRYHDSGDENTISRREVFQLLIHGEGSDSDSTIAVINDIKDTNNDGTNDADGIYDSVQVGANAKFTLRARYDEGDPPYRKVGTGLNDIRMHESTSSELTLTADDMRFTFAMSAQSVPNPNHKLLIQGDADDTVKLADTDSDSRGDFIRTVETEMHDGKTYAIFEARWDDSVVGFVLIVDEVTVLLPAAVALEKINEYELSSTAQGTPAVSDYTTAGVTDVTETNLAEINELVVSSVNDNLSIADIQAFVDGVNETLSLRTINAYNGTNTAPSVRDYEFAGVTGVSENNLYKLNELVKDSPNENLEASDIQGLVTQANTEVALLRINAYNGSNTAPSVTNYEHAGVTGVTESNLQKLNELVKDSPNENLGASDIQGLVTDANNALAVIAALAKINTYDGDSTQAETPEVRDYETAGVTGVTADNLVGVNAQVRTSDDDNLTVLELQVLVGVVNTTLQRINAYGSPGNTEALTMEDYTNAGVTGVTDAYLDGVNSRVATSPDNNLTIAEIQALLTEVSAALQTLNVYEGGVNDVRPTLGVYINAGVSDVTSTNLVDVNYLVSESPDDWQTTKEIQSLVNHVDRHMALDKINKYNENSAEEDTPTVEDYETAEVTGVTQANLDAVNAQVADPDNSDSTVEEIQALVAKVDALAKINAYDGPADPDAPTEADYTAAGVTGVTSTNLVAINTLVADPGNPDSTSQEIQALVEKADALAKINAYDNHDPADSDAPTVADYVAAGVTGVASTNLDAVNARVATSGNPNMTTSDIQTLLAAIVALTKINAYDGMPNSSDAPTAADYAALSVVIEPSPSVSRIKMLNAMVAHITEVITVERLAVLVDRMQDIEGVFDVVPAATQLEFASTSENFTTRINRGGVGVPEASVKTGEVTGTPELTYVEYDFNNDGVVDRRDTFTINIERYRTQTSIDLDADGTADRIEHYELDAAGNRTKSSFDDNADGKVDRIESYTVNSAGYRTQTEFDNDADGTDDKIETYTVDAVGYRTATSFNTDADTAGVAERKETYGFNPAGEWISTTIDADANDTPDKFVTYMVDDNGHRTGAEFRSSSDGTVERSETYVLNAAGQLTRTNFDNGNDGVVNRIETYSLNDRGLRDEVRIDKDADGTPDEIQTFTYTAKGILTRQRIQIDEDDDGTVDKFVNYIDENVDGIWEEIAYHDSNDENIKDQLRVNQLLIRGEGTASGSIEAVINDTDADGTYDSVQLGANAKHLIRAKYDPVEEDDRYIKFGWGLNDIRMHESTPSVLTLAARRMRYSFAKTSRTDQNVGHKLFIKGDADDTVKLAVMDDKNRGDFIERDTNYDGTVDTEEVDGTNYAIYDARWERGSAGSVFIQVGVNVLLPAVVKALKTINAYDGSNDAPTVEDYDAAKVTGVTEANLEAVNARVANSSDDDLTTSEIQALVVDAVLAKINAYDGSGTAPTAEDYTTVGVTDVNGNYLDGVNARVKAASRKPLTTSRIQTLVTEVSAALQKINAYNDSSVTGEQAPTVTDYSNAGVTKVTTAILDSVNAKIADSRDDELTTPEIQAKVDVISNAWTKILNYRDPENDEAPTADDYTAVGVTGVTGDNLDGVNHWVENLLPASPYTVQEYVIRVDARLKIINDYDGNNDAPTVATYGNLNITGVTESNLNAVNAQVADANKKDINKVDELSVPEIQALVVRAIAHKKIIDYGRNGNTNAPTVDDYIDAGVAGVNETNLEGVNTRMEESDATPQTTRTLRTLVEKFITLEKINAYDGTAASEAPTVNDYRAAGVTLVTADNLDDVNTRVVYSDNDDLTTSEIQTLVTNLIAASGKINAYDGLNDAPTIEDYTAAGATGITLTNLGGINALVREINTQTADSPSGPNIDITLTLLQRLVITLAAIERAYNEPLQASAVTDFSVSPTSYNLQLDIDGNGQVDRKVVAQLDVNATRDGDGEPGAPVSLSYRNVEGTNETEVRLDTFTLDSSGRWSAGSFDIGTNGTPDGTADKAETYRYNANGHLDQTTFYDTDTDANGTVDTNDTPSRIEEYEVGVNGQRTEIRISFDDNNDGRLDRTEIDNNVDGTADQIDIYHYGSTGNLEKTTSYATDTNGDGTVDATDSSTGVKTYRYNASGHLERTNLYDTDTNGNGTVDATDTPTEVTDYVVDSSGNRRQISISYDRNHDGTADLIERDTDADGRKNEIEFFQHHGEGFVLTRTGEDLNFDVLQVHNGHIFRLGTSYTITEKDVSTVMGVADLNDIRLIGRAALILTRPIVEAINRGNANFEILVRSEEDNGSGVYFPGDGQSLVAAKHTVQRGSGDDAGIFVTQQISDNNSGTIIGNVLTQDAVRMFPILSRDLPRPNVFAAGAKINAYDGSSDSPEDTPTVEDYNTAGINGDSSVTDAILNAVNAQVAASDDTDLTVEDIRSLVRLVKTALQKINGYNGGQNGVPTLADYAAIGVTGVTDASLPSVNAQVADANAQLPDSDPDLTPAQIQARVMVVTDILNKINQYDGNNEEPTTDDYDTVGVSGVNATNLTGVNTRVKNSLNNNLMAPDIQKFVTEADADLAKQSALEKLNAYDGTQSTVVPTTDDYTAVGVTGVTSANLGGINALVREVNTQRVEDSTRPDVNITVVLLQRLINTFAVIEDAYSGITQNDAIKEFSVSQTRYNLRFDNDGDGTADRVVVAELDVNAVRDGNGQPGAPTSLSYQDLDGTEVRRDSFTLDSDGRWSSGSFDSDGNGTADAADAAEAYRYNSNGHLDQTKFYETDTDGNGSVGTNDTPTRIEEYKVDDSGNRTEISVISDGNSDGTLEKTTFYEADTNGNGTIDTNDSPTRIQIDNNADGTTDRTETHVYNENGYLIRTALYETDTNGDGTVDTNDAAKEIKEYTVVANGDRTQINTSIDKNLDGTADVIEKDTDADGVKDETEFFQYTDERIVLTRTGEDLNFDVLQILPGKLLEFEDTSYTIEHEGDSVVMEVAGLNDIRLSDRSSITISVDTIKEIANGTSDFEILVRGDKNSDNLIYFPRDGGTGFRIAGGRTLGTGDNTEMFTAYHFEENSPPIPVGRILFDNNVMPRPEFRNKLPIPEVYEALPKINLYNGSSDSTEDTPTVSDYTNAGVAVINLGGVNALVREINTQTTSGSGIEITTTLLQRLVNTLTAIENANGERLLASTVLDFSVSQTSYNLKIDSNGDEQADQVVVVQLDVNADRDGTGEPGVPTTISYRQSDGTTETRRDSFALDSNRRWTAGSFDIGVNGTPDGVADKAETYRYNSNGHLDQTTFYNTDTDGNGTVDTNDTPTRVETYEVDTNGFRTRTSFDNNNDGTANRIEHDTNVDGTAEKVQHDTDGDGTIDIESTDYFQHIVAGQAVLTDSDNNGHFDVINVLPSSEFTLARSYNITQGVDKGFVGLDYISLSNEGASELNLYSISVEDMASGNTNHRVRIEGGTDDTVNLKILTHPFFGSLGKFAKTDDDNDNVHDSTDINGTKYYIYNALSGADAVLGSVLIQDGVQVILEM